MNQLSSSAGTALSAEVVSFVQTQHVNPRNNSAVQACIDRVAEQFGQDVNPEDLIGILEMDGTSDSSSSGRRKQKFVNHHRHRVCACRSGRSGRR